MELAAVNHDAPLSDSAPNILRIPTSQILADVGLALLQTKNALRLTLQDMADVMGRTDDMVAHYIAGESEMGMIAFRRACAAWPEFRERVG